MTPGCQTYMIKASVIGMGPIGNTHARAYQLCANAQLSAVCDRMAGRAENAGRLYGVPWYTDAKAMLSEIKPDICSIATGGFEYASDHYLPTVQALEAGCHVLCEKPISNDLAEAAEMVDLARRLGRCFALDFNHRFTPAALQAKKWQNEGKLGYLLFINMALWIGRLGDFETDYYHLKALNPHSMDMVRHYGGDVEEVHCYCMKAPGRHLWSTASWNLKFKNGAVGHVTSSYDIERGHPMERCEVAGTGGRMVVDDMWREATLYPAGSPLKEVYTNPVFGGYESFFDTFHCRIETFVNQVNAGAAPDEIDGTGSDGLEASRIIHAGIRSLQTGLPVKVHDIV